MIDFVWLLVILMILLDREVKLIWWGHDEAFSISIHRVIEGKVIRLAVGFVFLLSVC